MDSQFDTAVAAYESSVEVMPFREHVEAYSFLNAVGDICGRDVLDLGCGSGLYARQLRRAGAARAVRMDESARSRSLTVTWPPPVRLSTPHASPANGSTDQGSAWGRIEAMTPEADAPRYASRWGLHPLSVVRSARTGAPSRRFRSQGVLYRSICAGARIYDLGGVLKLLEAACELLGHMPVGALGGRCRRRSGRRRSRSWSRPTARRGVFMSAWRRAEDPHAGCALHGGTLAYGASLQQPVLALHTSLTEEEARRCRDYWTLVGRPSPAGDRRLFLPGRSGPLVNHPEALHRQHPDLALPVILPKIVTQQRRHQFPLRCRCPPTAPEGGAGGLIPSGRGYFLPRRIQCARRWYLATGGGGSAAGTRGVARASWPSAPPGGTRGASAGGRSPSGE